MFKKFKPSSPVKNVVLGQVATHDLDVGKNYKALQYVLTVTKTAPTAGFASASLSDALGLVVLKVGTVAKRQATAAQIDAIQTRWKDGLAAKAYDGVGNDLVTPVADVVADGNTTRTTTFVFTVNLAEPARDNFATRNPSAADWQALREKVLGESFESLAPNAAANLPAESAPAV